MARGETALDLLNTTLGSTDWLDGRAFSIADIALLAYTRLAGEGGFDLASRPNVTRWVEACEDKLGIGPS